MKLAVITHVLHYQDGDGLYAYAPYASELEVWADLFDEIIIAAPLRKTKPAGDCGRINRSNVRVVPQKEIGGEGWAAKTRLACSLPAIVWSLCQTMRQADAIHVRCPGNSALIGTILGPLFSDHLVAKYAGQWDPNKSDGLSVRVQRAVLRSPWWRGPVTVYGRWPNMRKHVVPFFSAALNAEQIKLAAIAAESKTPNQLRHVLFVGRLSRSKNIDILLAALARLAGEGLQFKCTVAGEGPEFANLQELSKSFGLGDSVQFTGGVSLTRVLKLYENAGILVLASQTEGWPKAIVEGMAFGLTCIGSDLGLVPEILGEGRGLVIPPRDVQALASALRQILVFPEQYSAIRARASAWAQHYSIDSLRESLRTLLAEHWGVATTRSAPKQVAAAVCVHE